MENKILFTILLSIVLASCGGLRSFHDYARAGDTVAVPVGMQPTFNKDNITVTITPSSGTPIILASSDPSIRAIINLYPDPISNMIISRELNENLTKSALDYEITTRYSANHDKDWYQTTVFVDLPSTLPIGLASIQVADDLGNTHTITLDIITGTGTANTFLSDINGFGEIPLDSNMLDSLARTPHITVFIESTETVPNAVEINFTHDPDETAGGTGEAFVTNPLGSRKNLTWHDNGINLKVILTESRQGLIDHMNDYKFYIAGTATNIQLNSITAYDNNGNIVSGVTGTLTNN